MNINELLKGINCSCGQHHVCDIQSVYIEENAMKRLPELGAPYQRIQLVADENTYKVAGESTEKYLTEKLENKVIFPGTPLLIPNETSIEAINQKITSNTDLIVGIGSGVIQDLCKYCAQENQLRYIIVATAPSMDGYASTGAAMITGGMKVTYKANVPLAILADPAVLCEAPFEMIKAGYGDIIGKFSALNDWKLSQIINDEYFCEEIYEMTLTVTKEVLSLAQGIKNRDAKAVQSLMEALVLVGIFMSFAGSSRPASGSEHHLSHFFEITGILFNRPYFPHGIDVAFSTIITAKIREELLKTDFNRPVYRLSEAAYKEKLDAIYGPIADDCAKLQEKYQSYTTNRRYAEKESQIKEVLALCPTAKEIQEMLALVNLDIKEYLELYGDTLLQQAISYAKELKDRYTVLWVYYDLLGEVPVPPFM